MCEQRQAVAGGVACEIDQNINGVRDNEVPNVGVIQTADPTPLVRAVAQSRGLLILTQIVAVAEDLESARIMGSEHGFQEVTHGVPPKIG